MTSLASVESVTRKLEDEPTDRMLVMIEDYLEYASDLARHFGNKAWTADNVPEQVSRIVTVAVARFMANPDGLSQSRSADETLAWHEGGERQPEFTDLEIDMIRAAAKAERPMQMPGKGFGSVQMGAWSTSRGRVHNPWDRGGRWREKAPWEDRRVARGDRWGPVGGWW